MSGTERNASFANSREVLKHLAPELIDRSLLPDKPAAKPPRAALELAHETGLVEPVVVRNAGNKAFPRYQLLSGDVALEIANRAALPRIPAVVIGSISESQARAFVRAHLLSGHDPGVEEKLCASELFQLLDGIEHAKTIRNRRSEKCSYASLAREYGLSPVLLSHLRRVRANLHRECLVDLIDGRISLGHAKALARFPKNEQPRIATRIIRRGYSVRRVEASAKRRLRQIEDDLSRGTFSKDPDVVRAEQEISHRFGWQTEIAFDAITKTGTVTFHFGSLEGYEYLLEQLGVDPRSDSE